MRKLKPTKKVFNPLSKLVAESIHFSNFKISKPEHRTGNIEPTTANSQLRTLYPEPPNHNRQPTHNPQPTTHNPQPTTHNPNLVYIGNHVSSRGGTPTSIDILAPLLKEEDYEVKTASSRKNKVLRLSEMLWTVFNNRKTTDFVLIDTYSTQNFWYAYGVARVCQLLNLKYIPILHGGDLPQRLKRSPAASQVIFGRSFMNVAPSLYLKTKFQKAGYVNMRYIPNSISLQEYSFTEHEKLRPRLFWVRAFAEIYNPLLALRTLELLLKDYPDAALCMVGPEKDDSFKRCRIYARRHRLPVKFTGKLSKQEWISLSSDYDLFLNTTNVDNTPVSVIEAMALGLPVISTNVGGLPYLIAADIDGMLVPPNNPQRMADAVKKLLDHPSQALQKARAARKKSEAFDWGVVKKKWSSVLRRE